MTDVVHCTEKTGTGTLRVIEKQWASKGLSRYDVIGGVGDGGGENEGVGGIHSLLEVVAPSYVRRRCFGHLPWRVADAALDAMGSLYKSTKSLCAYLRDGVTWTRLRAISTQPVALGGLALLRDGSRAFHAIFRKSPPSVLDERPETALHFIEWLLPRQDTLRKLVAHDLEQRSLTMMQATVARATLTSRTDCVLRHIARVIISKCLYLFYYAKSKEHIAAHDDFTDLIERASDIITSLRLDDATLALLGYTRQELIDNGVSNETMCHWVELVISEIPGIQQTEIDEVLPSCIEFHRTVCLRAATHLSLTAHNIDRTSWISARLLSKDPRKAQIGANDLRRQLVALTPTSMSNYERSLREDDILMDELGLFADSPHPCCLWRGGGRFKHLFTFLAARFLGAPDSVLHCEGVHARWKWLEHLRRSIKFKSLNAVLKLKDYLHSFGELPSQVVLQPHADAARDAYRMQYMALRDSGVEFGRVDRIYNDRFNLRPMDVELMRDTVQRPTDKYTAVTAWGMYVRFLFIPHMLYEFTLLDPNKYLYVAENKSFANREAIGDEDAIGRPLSVVWFQRRPGCLFYLLV